MKTKYLFVVEQAKHCFQDGPQTSSIPKSKSGWRRIRTFHKAIRLPIAASPCFVMLENCRAALVLGHPQSSLPICKTSITTCSAGIIGAIGQNHSWGRPASRVEERLTPYYPADLVGA